MTTDETPTDNDAQLPGSSPRPTQPWTITGLAVLVGVQAVIVFEHARRLLAEVTTAEETLGIAALGPLDQEVPAAVIEGFVATGLLIAAVAVIRRSQLALAYIVVVQAVIVLDVVLRLAGGLPVVSTAGMLVLALATGALALAPATRQWCNEPIW